MEDPTEFNHDLAQEVEQEVPEQSHRLIDSITPMPCPVCKYCKLRVLGMALTEIVMTCENCGTLASSIIQLPQTKKVNEGRSYVG
jgi:hypothetical protein